MDCHIECQALVDPAEQSWHQDQVSRARDWQELGKPLNQGQDNCLKYFHLDFWSEPLRLARNCAHAVQWVSILAIPQPQN